MRSVLIFPCVQILLSVGSAAVYAWHRQWWQVLYWVAAAVITVAVTFGNTGGES